MAHGKRYLDATKRFDRERHHTADEAIDVVKSLATANFDESVELVVRLGVDPRKADQMIRGTVALPSGTGKDVRIAVFAQGDAATAAEAAGAEFVGAEDLAANPPVVTKYVDGIKQDDWTANQSLDNPRRALQSTAILFGDGDQDERRGMWVNSIQIRAGKLSDAELAEL
ncbi:MAG TPA: hypothetical protein PKB00_12095, partial [Microthrixaceae bacterium]|nr:hypothetical protein [Microthrixaceae bacterium]